ncbi:hypothetical protein [Rufibacter sp. LB8]|uniref:hypothetical protein n=1 Tax=Rufibacter sp. LB8 TaxID=2777781 RepID=UPI00178C5A9D|nr:hypothetical protein [Rufibacter sp. LB8]
MKGYTTLLAQAGWKRSLAPIKVLGIDLSWLVMKEVFISPYNEQAYTFDEAMHQENQYHHFMAA